MIASTQIVMETETTTTNHQLLNQILAALDNDNNSTIYDASSDSVKSRHHTQPLLNLVDNENPLYIEYPLRAI